MNWLRHILINFFFASLYCLVSWSINVKAFLIIIFGAVPIDFDHIINDIATGRIKNPRKMLKRWYKVADIYTGEFHLLHNIETLAILLALSFYIETLLYILLAFTVHIASDYYIQARQTKSFGIKDFSIILHFLNRRKKQKL